MEKDNFLKISILITTLLIILSIFFNLNIVTRNYHENSKDKTLIDELIIEDRLSDKEALFYSNK